MFAPGPWSTPDTVHAQRTRARASKATAPTDLDVHARLKAAEAMVGALTRSMESMLRMQNVTRASRLDRRERLERYVGSLAEARHASSLDVNILPANLFEIDPDDA